MGNALEETQLLTEDMDPSIVLDDEGINIWIDKYSDVFSDFDTRPLVKRKLSNDLIAEICKLVSVNANSKVQLSFNILEDRRDVEVQNIIISHLKKHFTNSKNAENEKVKKTTRLGYFLTLLGFTIILIFAYVASLSKGVFFLNSLPVLIEPLAWFVTWTGLDHIFKNFGRDKSMDINSRMLEASISFMCMNDMMVEPEPASAPKTRKVVPAGNNLRIV